MDKRTHIIGAGLAGITLAWRFLEKKIPFVLYDSGFNHSSSVAAGLINPVVFKRLTKSWMADKLIPASAEFYQNIENILTIQLLSHKDIKRVFATLEEKNNWASKQLINPYLGEVESIESEMVQNTFETGKVAGLGGLNVQLFISASVRYFINQGIQIEQLFNNNKIAPQENYIFCEGYEVINNPYFSYLLMRPTHGDIITIKAPNLNLNYTVNKNMFIMPMGGDLYKIGATYNWDLNTPTPSEKGKKELLDKLKEFTDFDFEVVQHQAGIRPTVADRRPLLGRHPEHKNLFVFNGLGTKGAMLAPYFSAEIRDFVLTNKPLLKEVNIERYAKHNIPK